MSEKHTVSLFGDSHLLRMTSFTKLNLDWNADPNAPHPEVFVDGPDLLLSFRMNSMAYPRFREGERGVLRFQHCSRYRLGPENDEAWFRGGCRFSQAAPSWGEFYELHGDLRLSECPSDWIPLRPAGERTRHFLFYFRDNTFECDAQDWYFNREFESPIM